MHFLKYYNENIIKHDLLNKFIYKKSSEIPELKTIVLNFGCKNFSMEKFAITILALEIITNKKSTITTAKHPNVLLKIQKGQPAGCKVILLEKELVHNFLNKLLLEIFPKLKNFLGLNLQIKNSSFSFKLSSNELVLQELEEQYPLFANLPNLDIQISTNSQNSKELLFLIKALKFPIKQR